MTKMRRKMITNKFRFLSLKELRLKNIVNSEFSSVFPSYAIILIQSLANIKDLMQLAYNTPVKLFICVFRDMVI